MSTLALLAFLLYLKLVYLSSFYRFHICKTSVSSFRSLWVNWRNWSFQNWCWLLLLWAVFLFSLLFLARSVSILVLLLVSLTVFRWGVLVLLVVVLFLASLSVELLWSSIWLTLEWSRLGHKMWWAVKVSIELAAEWCWRSISSANVWSQVLIWVETTKSNNIS